jgi:hypothetical protein
VEKSRKYRKMRCNVGVIDLFFTLIMVTIFVNLYHIIDTYICKIVCKLYFIKAITNKQQNTLVDNECEISNTRNVRDI